MTFTEKEDLFYHAIKALPQGETRKQLEDVREKRFLGDKHRLTYIVGIEELMQDLTPKSLSESQRNKWIHDFCEEKNAVNANKRINTIIHEIESMDDITIKIKLKAKRMQAWKEEMLVHKMEDDER